jgi:hypothetical protein
MGHSTSESRKHSTPPPLSLSSCWDKAKWHFGAPSFPAHLPRSAGWSHILAALRFLDERGQLTTAGKQELADPDDGIVLISDHVRAAARPFLDQHYEAYLRAMEDYDSSPPVHVLEAGWNEYTTKYDICKRPKANPYQNLLLQHSPDRAVDGLLRALDRVPDLAARLRGALDDVPGVDRPLIEAALISREADPVSIAGSWPNPSALLHALRYLHPRSCALQRLRSATVLAERLRIGETQSADLVALVHGVNLGGTPEAEAAWRTLTEPEKRRLSNAVNSLFAGSDEIHLALCAMRTVGDAQSLKLIDQSVGDKRESVMRGSDGREEPGWEPVRREARNAIARRQSG